MALPEKFKCPVCGSQEEGHMQDREHGFYVASEPTEPLAVVVNVQSYYDSPNAVARSLAYVAAQMHRYFPDKRFSPFVPHTHIMRTDDRNNVIMGYSFPTRYLAYELPV